MNTTKEFGEKLNEISINDIIFTDTDIYKKQNNLDESSDLFILTQDKDLFRWERTFSLYSLPYYSTTENINSLSFTIETSMFKENEPYIYMKIYKVNDTNTLTHMMIFNKNIDIEQKLVWKELSSEVNIRLINKYVTSKPFKDIQTHIDLTKEYLCSDPYEFINEPLGGWDIDVNDHLSLDDDFTPRVEAEVNTDTNTPIKDEEIFLEDKYEEYRIDPYNQGWYTESEFINYYRGDNEWIHQHPKNILLREDYYKFAMTYEKLDSKKFIFLFKQYEKTFN